MAHSTSEMMDGLVEVTAASIANLRLLDVSEFLEIDEEETEMAEPRSKKLCQNLEDDFHLGASVPDTITKLMNKNPSRVFKGIQGIKLQYLA